MKKAHLYLLSSVLIALFFVFSIFSFTPGTAAVESTSANNSWIDHFDDDTLDPRWIWIREVPAKWSLSTRPGFMHIQSEGGLHEDITNDQKNILVTDAPVGDFRITTRVSVSPTINYHGAAIYIYQDDDNYLEVARVYFNDGGYVRMKKEVSGTTNGMYLDVSDTDLYLRILKFDQDYYGFYSLDGIEWEFIGQFNLPFTNLKIGISPHDSVNGDSIDAYYDFFQLEQINFNNTWRDDFSDSGLDPGWMWVREKPGLWSLTNQAGFMQITSEGSLHQDGNTLKNLLISEARSNDFRITTKVNVTPTENYHGGAIYIYQDDDNYIQVSRVYNDGDKVRLKREISGETNSWYVDVSATELYLRMIKYGNNYSGFYSMDGISWSYIHKYDLDFSNIKVGISAHTGPTLLAVTADYDYFQIDYHTENVYLPILMK
jgi:beta-xylosidase